MTSADFPLPRDTYVSFDGLTIKETIRKRLSETGLFTDQNFEGSNLSAFNDAIAMAFSLLLYNLNKTATESNLNESILYENVNRIVKLIDYSPLGSQTANLNFSLSAQNISSGTYNIPRYSYIQTGGIKYSLIEDFGFQKTTTNTLEEIDLSSDNSLLYQGYYQEFPTVIAEGIDHEIIHLTVADTQIIDNFHIDIYIKSINGKWEQWKKTQNLYLSQGNDKNFQIRFNENKRYEIKFGNDINGKKLQPGDSVAIYYLVSDGKKGEVGANVLDDKKMQLYTTPRITLINNELEIYNSYITQTQLNNLIFVNSCASTYYSEPETVKQIKENAPGVFRSQYSLTTAKSYENFIKSNFSNIVQDVKVMNNQDFLDSYIKYFTDLGLTKPHLESRTLFNHMKFGDACSFNNVYCFIVPKTVKGTLSYLNVSQKALIISTMKEEKTLTADILPMDAVYLAFDFGLGDSNTTMFDDVENTKIGIEKTSGSRRSDASIVSDVNQTILEYFARDKNKLGKLVSVAELTNEVLGIEGVKSVSTIREDLGIKVNGLRMVHWNPVYVDVSFEALNGNLQLENFQFGYSFTDDFTNRIIIS